MFPLAISLTPWRPCIPLATWLEDPLFQLMFHRENRPHAGQDVKIAMFQDVSTYQVHQHGLNPKAKPLHQISALYGSKTWAPTWAQHQKTYLKFRTFGTNHNTIIHPTIGCYGGIPIAMETLQICS